MINTADILKNIIIRKTQEIKHNRGLTSTEAMLKKAHTSEQTRGFYRALKSKADLQQNAVIAEIKKASPSKGILREDFNPTEIAKSYQAHGATCLSVLTDKYFFQGDNQHLINARAAVSLPVLRKEFIIDPYQVYEARAIGADCILLIAACLTDTQIQKLSALATELKMDVLIEVHNLAELRRTLKLNPPMIGINNRNLHTFTVSLQTTLNLLSEVKDDILVITESGILTNKDVALMRENQVYGYLVGEAFMRHSNPGSALREVFQ